MTIETELYNFFAPIIGGTVVWQDQNSPRPALPYSTLKYSSLRRVKMDHYSDIDNSGNQTVSGDREFTLTIQRFQGSGNNVVSTLQSVVDKLQLQSNVDKFLAKGLAAFNANPVMDISALLDATQIEKRAAVDIMIRYRSNLTDALPYIDTTVINADDNSSAPPYIITATTL